jgi:hypothetical protein
LITLNPGAALLLRLVEKLCASASSHIGPVNGWPATADERLAEAPPIVDPVRSLPWWAPTPGAVAACHARRGGNVREMLFDLYDRHERLCWELRSVGDTLAIEPIPA